MKFQHVSTCVSLIATSAIAFSAQPARAFNFTNGTNLGACDVLVDNVTVPNFKAFLDATLIKTCATADGFTLTASQNNALSGDEYLQGKMVDKDKVVKGVGITSATGPDSNPVAISGPVPGEITFDETLDVTLAPSKIKSFALSFLYLKGVFGDAVNGEVAKVKVNNSLEGTLTVKANNLNPNKNLATWVFNGGAPIDIIAIDPSKEVEGGYYSIDNPFGDLDVFSLSFTAGTEGLAKPTDSDYALVAIEKVSDVPEPATLLGLGLVGGLIAATRRKKSA